VLWHAAKKMAFRSILILVSLYVAYLLAGPVIGRFKNIWGLPRRLILPRCRWVCWPSGFFALWTNPLTWRSGGTSSMRLTGLAWNSPTRTTPPRLPL